MVAAAPAGPTMDGIATLLAESDPHRSWSLFLEGFIGTVYRAAERGALDADESRTLAVEVLERWAGEWPALLDKYGEKPAPDPDKADAAFRAWLAVVARNAVIDRRRALRGRPRAPSAVRRQPEWLQDAYRSIAEEGVPHRQVWERLREEGRYRESYGEFCAAVAELEGLGPAKRVGIVALDPHDVDELGDRERADPELSSSTRDALGSALEELPGDERALLRVYYLEGVPAAELVRVFGGKTRSQVYNRIHSTITKLRSAAEARGLGPEDTEALSTFDWRVALGAGTERDT